MLSTSDTLQFQIIGGSAKDVRGAYQILLFGATAEGKSVSCTLTGFRPYFYIELPDDWTSAEVGRYRAHLLESLAKEDTGRQSSLKLEEAVRRLSRRLFFDEEEHKSFWDFTAGRTFRFLRVSATSKRLWTRARDLCLDRETATPLPLRLNIVRQRAAGSITLRVFEANIDPMLRFFHLRELQPAGWATIAGDLWETPDMFEGEAPLQETTAAIQAIANWDDIAAAPAAVQLTAAPLRLMAWDIECTSSHGDFPLANKTWRKPARELVEADLRDWAAAHTALAAAVSAEEEGTGPLSRVYLSESGRREIAAGIRALEAEWPTLDDAWGGETAVDRVDALLSAHLPAPEGDPVIQIGSVVYVGGKPVRKDIFVLGSCTRLPGEGTYTHSCATEADLITGWCDLIQELDPDIMVGYNIFGFDDKYLWDRAVVAGCEESLAAFSRIAGVKPELKEKKLSSSAMGDNTFYVLTGEGRLHIDLLAYVRRNAVLDSYSLDNVTATFMSGGVGGVAAAPNHGANIWAIKTKSTKGTLPGRYVVLMDEENDVIGEKLEVVAVEPKMLYVAGPALGEALADHGAPPVRWSQSKDDVSPKDIFALHAQGPRERAVVAKYCIQDCDLVVELFQKLEVLNNSIAMANVCWVPVEFIFTRGQGIKSESLVFYECRLQGQLIPVLPAPPRRKDDSDAAADLDAAIAEVPEILTGDDNEGYEGAIVLNPLSGIYLDDEPVAALDFSSLYPSSIISENISHDSVVWVKDYDLAGNFVRLKEGSDAYDNLPGWEYLEVEYDILKPDPAQAHKKHPDLVPAGRRICRYAQPLDPNTKSTLPNILRKLLAARKATRKQAEKETDDFRRALLDAQQLAYKLTANSLYGQLGSNTSKVRRKCLAASTTGHGRQQLLFSKACIEQAYGPTAGDPRCSAVAVYGDTDSVFISFRPMDPATGQRLTGRAAQEAAKALAEEAGNKISGALKPPHDFEFDKMFRCFCLLSKKRYVGDMTEGGLEDSDYHRKSMGIVMKRRDNAPIVKYVYGGVIERILNQRDIQAAFCFARQAVQELLAGKFLMKRLTITKSLRAEYKVRFVSCDAHREYTEGCGLCHKTNPPAHKILADRIGKRDPGNKPASNDRIPFVYVVPPKGAPAPTNQGERIETPTYIREKGLRPDYAFYVSNQIAKPVAQVFGLVLEKLPGYQAQKLAAYKLKDTTARREAYAEELLFGDLLRIAARDAAGQRPITSFFTAAARS
jgi:DNA polymerase elongation subunit (family B)